MELDIEVLKDWRDDVKSAIRKELGCLQTKQEHFSDFLRVLDAMDEVISENDDLREELERKHSEVDDLSEQLERKEAEIDSLRMQLLDETGDLRQQLLDAKEQTLEATTKSKPMEIHNHFESGSNSQVFNDKVNGKFTKNKDKKKKEKKRWKRIVRKVL